MVNQRLPIGIQDFVRIREDDFLYVDKTARIYQLISNAAGPIFLSRPRRFGKSLLCSTLGALFEGRRELFSDLTIDSLDWKWIQHPVVRIDLNAGDFTRGIEELFSTINRSLEFCARKYNIPFEGQNISDRFARLIANLHDKYTKRVAVIIDEYDKPLLSIIDKPELHEEIKNTLKSFYGVLKSADEHLQFVFLTGVTKFSRISIFSDLNNISDISLDERYGDLCGITQDELEIFFSEPIAQIAQSKSTWRDEYLGEIKRYYNGYRFSPNPVTVYNPFGLLNHFDKSGQFESYWFATGTPTFLIKLIEKQKIDILSLEHKAVRLDDFHKFDIDNMDAVPVLYQSGYLTIADYDKELRMYTLDYPNEEVRSSFAKSLMEHYIQTSHLDAGSLSILLSKALNQGDIAGVMNTLVSFFAAIPYDIQIKNEKYYQTIVHLVFRMLGFYCRSEVRIAAGRIDTLVETKKCIYCFEFKLDGSAEAALQQIDTKEYLLPWQGSGKKLFKIGVDFNFEKRNINEWVIKN